MGTTIFGLLTILAGVICLAVGLRPKKVVAAPTVEPPPPALSPLQRADLALFEYDGSGPALDYVLVARQAIHRAMLEEAGEKQRGPSSTTITLPSAAAVVARGL